MAIYMLTTAILSLYPIVTSIRMDSFKEVCPGKEASVYVPGPALISRNKIECVAGCHQDDSCTSITYKDNICSLFTSYDTPCGSRKVSENGYLEKVNSNWCSHGGYIGPSNRCACGSLYQGQFCQIGRSTFDSLSHFEYITLRVYHASNSSHSCS